MSSINSVNSIRLIIDCFVVDYAMILAYEPALSFARQKLGVMDGLVGFYLLVKQGVRNRCLLL